MMIVLMAVAAAAGCTKADAPLPPVPESEGSSQLAGEGSTGESTARTAEQKDEEGEKTGAGNEEAVSEDNDQEAPAQRIEHSLKNTKHIQDVQVIVTEDSGGYVIVDYSVPSSMSKKEAEKQANEIADELKSEYGGSTIDVLVRKHDQEFVQVKRP